MIKFATIAAGIMSISNVSAIEIESMTEAEGLAETLCRLTNICPDRGCTGWNCPTNIRPKTNGMSCNEYESRVRSALQQINQAMQFVRGEAEKPNRFKVSDLPTEIPWGCNPR